MNAQTFSMVTWALNPSFLQEVMSNLVTYNKVKSLKIFNFYVTRKQGTYIVCLEFRPFAHTLQELAIYSMTVSMSPVYCMCYKNITKLTFMRKL